jgi:hypothetical protein
MYMNDIPQSFPFSGLSLVDPFPFASIFQTTIYFDIVIGCFYSIDVKNFVAQEKVSNEKKKRLSNNEAVQNVRAGVLRVYRMVGGSGPIPPLPNWIKPISRNNVQSPVCNLFITQII